jgi:predicted transcriptional regulator
MKELQDSSSFYSLSEWELELIQEGILEYEKGEAVDNDEVFSKNEKWLNE